MLKLVRTSSALLCLSGMFAFADAGDDHPTEQAGPAAVATQPPSKRDECRVAAKQQGLKAQAASDQIQICMAQARLDCTRAAVSGSIPNAQRRDFIRTCINGDR